MHGMQMEYPQPYTAYPDSEGCSSIFRTNEARVEGVLRQPGFL